MARNQRLYSPETQHRTKHDWGWGFNEIITNDTFIDWCLAQLSSEQSQPSSNWWKQSNAAQNKGNPSGGGVGFAGAREVEESKRTLPTESAKQGSWGLTETEVALLDLLSSWISRLNIVRNAILSGVTFTSNVVSIKF